MASTKTAGTCCRLEAKDSETDFHRRRANEGIIVGKGTAVLRWVPRRSADLIFGLIPTGRLSDTPHAVQGWGSVMRSAERNPIILIERMSERRGTCSGEGREISVNEYAVM